MKKIVYKNPLVKIISSYILLFTPLIFGDEIKFGFKSPSFSGVGTSAHYLTIENQEFTRREALEAEIKALKEAAKREEENTTLARSSVNASVFLNQRL
jgi:hypothetical protein